MSLEGKILGHFGYPKDLSRQKPGITIGYAGPDKAFRWLEQLKDLAPYMDRTKKVRVAFEYDPDFPMALLVIEGMKKAGLPIIKHLRNDYKPYDPAHPDSMESFHWNNSPFTEIEKPDGN